MSTIKHIWFDFGGTLYRETPKFHAVHDQHRYKTYAELTGKTDHEVAKQEFHELYNKHGSNSAVFRSLGQSSDYWMKSMDELDFTAILHPDPEVTETLKNLQPLVGISLFTNFPHKRIVDLLDHLEIQASMFTHILSGDDVAERKPALDGFHLMVEKSGIPANQILYVGDRVDVDVKPAKAVGMKTCLLYTQSDEADFCFNRFEDLLTINFS